jgi:predicted metal-dependent HD superfamily phosphohydrolase
MMDIRLEFEALWKRMGCQGNWIAAWTERETRYQEHHRYYHTLTHIAHVFRELMPVLPNLKHPNEVLWAAMDHDVILTPAQDGVMTSGNERASATLAMWTLGKAKIDPTIYMRVGVLIAATDHRDRELGNDARYLVDADLAILGQPWLSYLTYYGGVRAEYLDCGVSREQFRTGRIEFLTTLDQKRIYHTAHFSKLYGTKAHDNIKREISLLKSEE